MNVRTSCFLGVLLVVPFSFGACGPGPRTTLLTSFTDPAFVGRSFDNLVVSVPIADLHWRHAVERALVSELARRGVRATESVRLLPPTRAWTDSARHVALRAAGVSAQFVLTEIETWTSVTHTPASSTTTVTREQKSNKDSTKTEKERVRTTYQEATTVSRPWVKYEIRLIETGSDSTVWIGVDWLPHDESGLEEFRERFVASLVADGVVAGGR